MFIFSSCFLYHHVLSFSCQRPLKKARGQRQTSVPSSAMYCSVHNKILPLCLSVRSFPFPCFLSVCHSCFLLPSGGSHGGQRADAVPSRRTAAFLASDVFKNNFMFGSPLNAFDFDCTRVSLLCSCP